FIAEGTHTIVPIRECSALEPELNRFIPEANALLERPEMASVREIRAVCAPPVAAAFVSDRGEVHTCRFGESIGLTVNDFVSDVDPNAFFQSNRPLLGDFMREVLDQAGASPKYVLDLFCGGGFFSIPLAKRSVEVIGVESSGVAIRKARLNATL